MLGKKNNKIKSNLKYLINKWGECIRLNPKRENEILLNKDSFNILNSNQIMTLGAGSDIDITAGGNITLTATGSGGSIELKPETSLGDLVLTGANLESTTVGTLSNNYLRIKLNGVYYKIRLFDDV